jgi:hypothetical protein
MSKASKKSAAEASPKAVETIDFSPLESAMKASYNAYTRLFGEWVRLSAHVILARCGFTEQDLNAELINQLSSYEGTGHPLGVIPAALREYPKVEENEDSQEIGLSVRFARVLGW